MTCHHPPRFFARRYLLDIGQIFVAAVIAIAGLCWPASVAADDDDKNPAQTRFQELVPWLPTEFLPAGKLIAFEEHPHFVYLAQKGFDVTAIDVAPTALNLAHKKAEAADVKVRWLLADVLTPPADLKTFDFIFDRGCYHGVRSNNAQGYVKTVKRLSQPGTHILILAGNANEQRHYGPPRVKEKELRNDFSSAFDFIRLDTVHFDSIDAKQQGALAWSILLRRKAQ